MQIGNIIPDKIIEQLTKEMNLHMQKEERVLFPLIKYLYDSEKFNERPKSRNYGTIRYPIRQMLSEHEVAIKLVRKIKSLLLEMNTRKTSDTFKLFCNLINEFELDLYTHIHLENNLLFPEAVNLEIRLTNL